MKQNFHRGFLNIVSMVKCNIFFLIIMLTLPAAISAVAADNQLIVGWGDSLTEGYCTYGYNAVLQTQMADAGRPSTQVNCGVGGEISTISLQRLKETMLCDGVAFQSGYCTDKTQKYIWGACDGYLWSRKGWYDYLNGQRPDFILIWIGANDEINKIGLNTTVYNIKEMIRVSRQYEITPIIATLTPDGSFEMYRCDEGDLGGFNYTLKGLAQDENVVLADQCAAIPYWTDNHCGDLLHPNEKGNQTIARTWLGVLPKQSDYQQEISMEGPLLLLLD